MISVIIIAIIIGLIAWNVARRSNLRNRLTVESLGDGKGVFVGERRPQYKESDPSKWSPETKKRVEEHEASVRAIDESWENRKQAYSYFQMGRYDDSIDAYRKAYQTGKGNEAFFGLELVTAYEKLKRYDEALALLDDISSKVNLSESGQKNFKEIRTRLIAAKNANVNVIDQ